MVLYSHKACIKVLTTKNEPVANKIDGNVQLYVLSHIPDNVQSVTKMVFDCLPKPPRVAVLQIYLNETQLSSLGANNVEYQNTFDLRSGDLSTKRIEMFHDK